MRRFACIALALMLTTPAAAQTGLPEDCSRAEAAGDRVLCHSLVVAAPAADVWGLISTTEGWRSWAAPVAAVDLRSGASIETSYNTAGQIGDAGNIRNRVIAFTPERLLVIQIANAPPDFPHADLARELTTAIELEPIDANHTRVRVTMMGYRNAPGFDELYAFFERGNALTLRTLGQRIEYGPVSWAPPSRAQQ